MGSVEQACPIAQSSELYKTCSSALGAGYLARACPYKCTGLSSGMWAVSLRLLPAVGPAVVAVVVPDAIASLA